MALLIPTSPLPERQKKVNPWSDSSLRTAELFVAYSQSCLMFSHFSCSGSVEAVLYSQPGKLLPAACTCRAQSVGGCCRGNTHQLSRAAPDLFSSTGFSGEWEPRTSCEKPPCADP